MKVLALVGESVAPAFRLAGMEVLSPDHDKLRTVFQQELNRHDLALIIISARYALVLKNDIEAVRVSNREIIILEISSSQGDYRAGEKLMKYIREVVGQG